MRLRPLHPHDLPRVAEHIAALKDRSIWAHHPEASQFTPEAVRLWLVGRLRDPHVQGYVKDDLTAGCMGWTDLAPLPPHPKRVIEIAWWGAGRDAARCWQAVKTWGRLQGAVLAGYTLLRPARRGSTIEEWRWVRLSSTRTPPGSAKTMS